MALQVASTTDADVVYLLNEVRDERGRVTRAQAAARCHFLDLPGELRNQIYDYVFDQTCHIPKRGEYHSGNISHPVVLLHTCRQIHHETQLLPYKRFTFSFYSKFSLGMWERKRTKQQLKLVSRIVFGFSLKRPTGRYWCRWHSGRKPEAYYFERMDGLRQVVLQGHTSKKLYLRFGEKDRLAQAADKLQASLPNTVVVEPELAWLSPQGVLYHCHEF